MALCKCDNAVGCRTPSSWEIVGTKHSSLIVYPALLQDVKCRLAEVVLLTVKRAA